MPQTTTTPERSGPRFHLAVRIGGVVARGPTGSVAANAGALAADILATRLGETPLIDAKGNIHAYCSGNSGWLLAASRALQLAFANFRHDASSPEPQLSIAVILDKAPSIDDCGELTETMAESIPLLDLAQPWQILMTRTFLDHLACRQSLWIEPASAGTGIYEFAWTGKERRGQLQAQTPTPHTLLAMPAAPVAEPTLDLSVASLTPAQVAARRFNPLSGIIAHGAALLATMRAWLGSRPQLRRHWAGAGLGILLLLAATYLIARRHGSTTSAASPARSRQPSLIKPAGVANTNPQTASGVQAADEGKLAPKPAPPLASTPMNKPKGRTCLIGDQIGTYLGMAENNRTRGHYEDAVRQYNKVLDCEPANHEARLGLERIRESGVLHSPKR
jgi:hypothetical protein